MLDIYTQKLYASPCPKVLITMIILVSFMDTFSFESKWDVVDMFAGQARIARMGRRAGLRACAHDIDYTEHKKVFDINTPGGFLFL